MSNESGIVALFEPFDDEWKSTTRSIRINGTVTSVRLENFYWRVVSEIADKQDIAVPQLMSALSRTAKEDTTEHTNFTSFVRVCCGRYLHSHSKSLKAEPGFKHQVASSMQRDCSAQQQQNVEASSPEPAFR